MTDFALISDLFKDAYGCRPSSDWMQAFDDLNQSEKQAMWDSLCQVVSDEIDREHEMQSRAYTRFLTDITRLLDAGAPSYNDAVRWLVDSMGVTKDELEFYGASYVCYTLGLSYDKAPELAKALGCREGN